MGFYLCGHASAYRQTAQPAHDDEYGCLRSTRLLTATGQSSVVRNTFQVVSGRQLLQ